MNVHKRSRNRVSTNNPASWTLVVPIDSTILIAASVVHGSPVQVDAASWQRVALPQASRSSLTYSARSDATPAPPPPPPAPAPAPAMQTTRRRSPPATAPSRESTLESLTPACSHLVARPLGQLAEGAAGVAQVDQP